MPPERVVERAPLKVVLAEPAFWAMVPAEMAAADTSPPLTTVKEVTGTRSPISAAKVTLPDPAVKLRV